MRRFLTRLVRLARVLHSNGVSEPGRRRQGSGARSGNFPSSGAVNVTATVNDTASGPREQRPAARAQAFGSTLEWARHLGVDPLMIRCAFGDALEFSEDLAPAERARRRAAALLLKNLTQAQLRQYLRHRTFDVIGGQSGKRYRLWHRTMQNIEELDPRGRRRCIWCFHPIGLDLCDVLLAQKTALELFEYDALRIAQRYSDFAFNSAPPGAPWR